MRSGSRARGRRNPGRAHGAWSTSRLCSSNAGGSGHHDCRPMPTARAPPDARVWLSWRAAPWTSPFTSTRSSCRNIARPEARRCAASQARPCSSAAVLRDRRLPDWRWSYGQREACSMSSWPWARRPPRTSRPRFPREPQGHWRRRSMLGLGCRSNRSSAGCTRQSSAPLGRGRCRSSGTRLPPRLKGLGPRR